jgi:hypothetical protein
MLSKKITYIINKSTWKKGLIFTAFFLAMYLLINFSGIGAAGLLKITGGANILDIEFGYSPDEAYGMLTALGGEGRHFYLTRILPLDFVFPMSYMLFYTGWMAPLLRRAAGSARIKYLLFVPVMAMLYDWAENISIIALLRSYPGISARTANLASVFGMFKLSFTLGSILSLIILVLYNLLTRIGAKWKIKKKI